MTDEKITELLKTQSKINERLLKLVSGIHINPKDRQEISELFIHYDDVLKDI